jgi:hypothetical protein
LKFPKESFQRLRLCSSITVQSWQWFVHNAGTTQECKMPNGRSGGFVIETVDLRELVKAVSDTTVVGQAFVNSLPPRLVSSSEVSRLVEECRHDRIAVEEQDNAAYVIHLSNVNQQKAI